MSSSAIPGVLPAFEPLETRLLLSGDALVSPTFSVYVLSTADEPAAVVESYSVSPLVTNPTPYGMTPAQVLHAYGFDTLMLGQVVGDGSGQTIAIVDAYNAPNIVSDLSVFDAAFGISDYDSTGAFCLTVHKMATNVRSDSGWALEISLDVEWAHAIAPGAHILLVEAKSNSIADLLSAVDYARSQAGVVAVSMSWGSSEFSGETTYDSYFTTPSGHVGGSDLAGSITFLASSGDDGAPAMWPSVSSNVVSVGGTTLTVDTLGTWLAETGWSGSGGSISTYVAKPSYQSSVTLSTTKRTSPDIAYNADTATGFAVYDSYTYNGQSGWFQVGGTSAGAPQWAALIAIVDQARALVGEGSIDGRAELLPDLYTVSASDYHDIVSGNNGNSALAGYDLVTGRGSPIVDLLVPDVVGGAQVVSVLINGGSVQRSEIDTISFTFDESITISASSLTLYDDSTGTSVSLSGAGFSYSAASHSATWTFTALGLANGNYTATLVASLVTDASSSLLFGGNYEVSFFRLLCDANGDRMVNGGDLALWQSNYDPIGLVASDNAAKGDWNGDGRIDGGDLALWQQNYNPVGLAAPAVVTAAVQTMAIDMTVVVTVEPEPASAPVLAAAATVEEPRERQSAPAIQRRPATAIAFSELAAAPASALILRVEPAPLDLAAVAPAQTITVRSTPRATARGFAGRSRFSDRSPFDGLPALAVLIA